MGWTADTGKVFRGYFDALVIRSIRVISGDVSYPPGVEVALHKLHPQLFTGLPASLAIEDHGLNGYGAYQHKFWQRCFSVAGYFRYSINISGFQSIRF